MISPLRRRLIGLLSHLARPFRPPRPRCAVKGCTRSVIVVRPPDRRFTQVLFFLRDDYLLSDDADPERLLQQAREAAQDYTLRLAPPLRFRFPWLLLFMTAALLLGVLKILGLL